MQGAREDGRGKEGNFCKCQQFLQWGKLRDRGKSKQGATNNAAPPPSSKPSGASRPLMTFTRMQTHTHKSFAFVSSDSNKIQKKRKTKTKEKRRNLRYKRAGRGGGQERGEGM